MALCRIGRTNPRVGRAATPPGPCAATPFSGFHAHETIRSRRSGPTTSTSAQFCQTCAVSSQSIRQPSTYFPGRKLDGTTTRSATMPSVQSPEQYPQWSSLPPVAQPPSPGCASQSNQPRSTSGHGEGNCWQSPLAALHGPRRGGPSVHSPSRAKPRLSVLMRGTGLRAHVEPSGRTAEPLTKLPRMGRRVPLFQRMACALLTKSSGVRWKHSSVSGSPRLQSRKRYPPPCCAVICHLAVAVPPRLQTVPVGRGLSTSEPRSPCMAWTVALKAPALKTSLSVPPALPHASKTGALPGALQGWKRQMSSYEPGFA
mmetsp:Transcript_19335/g.62693  ORF Transcript_19335/g.62693 Transcript_19335/m.62693 type:complete len:314 (+) Transcript_19335:148-1089(+)